MKRIAAPMVGGVITSAVVVLLVYPAIYFIWKGWRLPKGPATAVFRQATLAATSAAASVNSGRSVAMGGSF